MEHINEAFVGFDTSKLRNAVAIAESGRDGEVRYLGEIDNTETGTRKLDSGTAWSGATAGATRDYHSFSREHAIEVEGIREISVET